MKFFGIEQRDGVVRIPGPVSMPNLDYTEIADLVAALDAKLDAADYTAADVLAKLLTVDGPGSFLDADTLDGLSSAAFATAVHTHAQSDITGLTAALALKLDASSYTAADVLTKIKTVDGSSSGLDADLLGGIASSDYARLSQLNTFTFGAVLVSGSTSLVGQVESDQSADEQIWAWLAEAKIYQLNTYAAGFASSRSHIRLTRGTGLAVTAFSFGNTTDNPTYAFTGTGTATFSGQVSALRFVPTSSTVPTNGLYLPTANNPGLSANSTKVIDWTSTVANITGNLSLTTAGNKLLIKEGSNASMGVATLAAGTVVVNNTLVTASSRIFLTIQSLGTVATPKAIGVTARTAGTSFTITSADATDTSVVAWHITEPA